MGILKTAATVILGLGVFYGGMIYERGEKENELKHLNNKVRQMQTIDYKILSLTIDMAQQPYKIQESIGNCDELVKNPEKLQERLEDYDLFIEIN